MAILIVSYLILKVSDYLINVYNYYKYKSMKWKIFEHMTWFMSCMIHNKQIYF